MAFAPETLQGISEIAGAIALAVLSAFGGYKASAGKRKPRGADVIAVAQRRCPDHTEFAVTVGKIPDIHKDLKVLSKKVDQLFDQVFTILREHERKIGQLQGAVGAIDKEEVKP